MHRPHADDEEHERPDGERELERQQDVLSRALVGSAPEKKKKVARKAAAKNTEEAPAAVAATEEA